MPIYLYNGKILTVNNAIAANEACCCDFDSCVNGSVTISVCIDGSDLFYLNGHLLTNSHLNYDPPGTHPDCSCSNITVNGTEWPILLENNPFNLKSIGLSFGKAASISVEQVSGRSNIIVVQQPTEENNWTGGVLVDDDPVAGPTCEEFTISWSCTESPTPAAE